jgi:transcription antitermination factor NusG
MLDAAHNPALHPAQPDAFHARNDAPCGGYSGPRWFVVQTHPQSERWASSNLTRRGYQTFLPLVFVTRRDRVLRTLTHRVEVPLFASYCFVRFDAEQDPWTPIWHTPGVAALLVKDGRKPNPVAEADFRAVEAAVAAARSQGAETASWAPGTPCSLATGPFRGHPAVVLSVRSQHARLSVMILGGLREVQAPVAWLTERS